MKKVIAVALMLVGFNVFAEEVVRTPVNADTPEKMKAVIGTIESEFSPGGRYEFLSASDHAALNALFFQMMTMLERARRPQCRARSRALFNVQEKVNGLLTHSDRNRLVCEHSASLGTHIQSNTCHTVAEIELRRKNDHDFMVDNQKERRHSRWILPDAEIRTLSN